MENLKFEELTLEDINRDYLDILSQISPERDLSHISVEDAKKAHRRNKLRGRINYVLKRWISDPAKPRTCTIIMETIGVGSIIFDYRIATWPRPSCHVEDVAIKKTLHGFGYGRILMGFIEGAARAKNAYKLILSCNDYNTKFYKKCGYIHTCNTLRKDFDEDYPVKIEEV